MGPWTDRWSTRAERYRSSLRAAGRSLVISNTVPRTMAALDTYLKGRRGDLTYTRVRWGRVALAFCLAGLLLAAICGIHKVFS